MKLRLYVALALMAMVPTLATAQKGGKSSGGGDEGGGGGAPRGGASFKAPTRGDLEDMNPASFLIDKKKKLQLTDEQVAAVKVVEEQIKERYKVSLAAYDSLRRGSRSVSASVGSSRSKQKFATDAPSPAEQASMQVAMRGIQQALMGIRNQRTADVDAALAAITDPAVKAKAIALLKDQEEDFMRLMPGGDRDR
jgi:hypothetical protein